jgi:inorganic pyrophosphatase
MASAGPNPMIDLEPFDEESGTLNVIIDTPKGSRNKFKYDERSEIFKLGGALPLGVVFPFDFGYIPSTRAEDGDPLDVLILMDEPAFTGCR